MTRKSLRWVAALIDVMAIVMLPLWLRDPYSINIASQVLYWAIFALGLNVLVGYGGLTSLGHAGLFGVSGYTAALIVASGHGHVVAILAAIGVTIAMSALFAVLALRASGIGFLMITLALGQILWGLAYRWASLTNGDNGVSVPGRPAPFGIDLAAPSAFYWLCCCAFLVCLVTMACFVRSPFGASLRGTRDQPRRMSALGFNVWVIRFLAFLFSGFWSAIAGLLFVYYNQFISPQVMALQSSAEVLLMVISGGTATLAGPVVGAALVVIMKNVVSAYVERWNMALGIIFVLIISFMPEGLVPGSVRLARAGLRSLRRGAARASAGRPAGPRRGRAMSALVIRDLCKAFGGLRVTRDVSMSVEPGERRLIIGPNGAGKTTLFNQITGDLKPSSGTVSLFGEDITRAPSRARAHLGLARTYQIITLFQADTILRNVTLALLGRSRLRWNPFVSLDRQSALIERAEAALEAVGLARLKDRPLSETSYGERRRIEIAMALAQDPKVLLLDEPFAGLSTEERHDIAQLLAGITRDVTVLMIEHDMDVALGFADRITLLNFGEVIVEGSRADVVADPRTREVYLGH